MGAPSWDGRRPALHAEGRTAIAIFSSEKWRGGAEGCNGRRRRQRRRCGWIEAPSGPPPSARLESPRRTAAVARSTPPSLPHTVAGRGRVRGRRAWHGTAGYGVLHRLLLSSASQCCKMSVRLIPESENHRRKRQWISCPPGSHRIQIQKNEEGQWRHAAAVNGRSEVGSRSTRASPGRRLIMSLSQNFPEHSRLRRSNAAILPFHLK